MKKFDRMKGENSLKRSILLGALFLFLMQGTAGAVANVAGDMISKAQQYGIVYAKKSTQDFLKPWTAYEEEAMTLTEQSERAYIYTPYLLVASDARDRQNKNQAITLNASKEILKNYDSTLTFQVILYGSQADFANGMTATLVQGNTVKTAYQQIVPDRAAALTDSKQYSVKCYFYFEEKGLDLKSPVTLKLNKKDVFEKKFYFALAKVR